MTFAPGYVEPVPPMVSLWTNGWGWISEAVSFNAPISATYEFADRALYHPVYVPTVCVARRLWWANGASVAGNIEVGIYRDADHKPGAKLITTGSVAQATVSVVQFADITDTTLTPGLYWLYLSASSVSGTLFRVTLNNYQFLELGGFQESAAPGSAPATATPVERVLEYIYMFGFSTTTIT